MRTIAIYLIFLFSNFLLHAQYRKMPLDTNHYWQQRWGRVGNFPTDFKDCSGTFKVRRDTLINGKVFKLVESRDAFCYQSTFGRSSIIIRDDTIKKLVTFIEGQQEKILFNFNKNVGDTAIMLSYFGMDTVTIFAKDSVLLNDGFYHKRLFFSQQIKDAIIEGVGGLGGLFTFWTINFEFYSQLLCLGQISPGASIYNSEGLGASCPNITGIPIQKKLQTEILISPNPCNEVIKIEIGAGALKSVVISDLLGQTVLRHQPTHKQFAEINTSALTRGLYVVTIATDHLTFTQRLVKN